MRTFLILASFLFFFNAFAQNSTSKRWADSVYNSLSDDERIAQLMVVRLSSLDVKNNKVLFYDSQVLDMVKKYNIGAICLFQGSPEKQAAMINNFQSAAKTPIMVCIDAEWGVGQRFLDDVIPLPKQMMLGAMKDSSLLWQYGKLVAEQCKRLGIHVNYAPVADINNNPLNPVINDRSFGENKFKVAAFAVQYMKGLQDNGIMACAKHFPGHGDVIADSHFDLPVINKTIAQLDSLEFLPFKALFNAGVASAMMAHLYIPAIEATTNMATSLSRNNVTQLLRTQLKYNGITFTDALDMKAVQNFFPNGASSVESIIAGNDMLCLPSAIPQSIAKIKEAIAQGKITNEEIKEHCIRILEAKFKFVRNNTKFIPVENINTDLNKGIKEMIKKVAENAITLVSAKDKSFFPLKREGKIAYVGIGTKNENAFSKQLIKNYGATTFMVDLFCKDSNYLKRVADSANQFDKIIIGIHNINRKPANNFDISKYILNLIKNIEQKPSILFLFGNAYAAANWCDAANMVVCYENDDVIQETAADMLCGKLGYKGTLPVTVCAEYKYGHGIIASKKYEESDFSKIDSIALDAIKKKAMPGCVILLQKEGNIIYEKAFGTYTYESGVCVKPESIYDVASITKIAATTIAIMKLVDENKIDINKTLGDYLPFFKHTNKSSLIIKDILLHQAGLAAYIPFYKETINRDGTPSLQYYSSQADGIFSVQVAEKLFVKNDYPYCMMETIAQSSVGEKKYVYSDNDFILLGKIVEEVSGKKLNDYVYKYFYQPMQLASIGYLPLQRINKELIAPTEKELSFRLQLIRGTVHDPGAALMGGVAGHAGLFSNAKDLAAIMQMLLNKGMYNGKRYLSESTVALFTDYNSSISRRGLGFDKPEKDNNTRLQPYPAATISPLTFGHTGFTGTAAWADPAQQLVFVFLSNRVYPDGNNRLNKLNVRLKMLEEASKVLQ